MDFLGDEVSTAIAAWSAVIISFNHDRMSASAASTAAAGASSAAASRGFRSSAIALSKNGYALSTSLLVADALETILS